ncbi:hypothetical protein AYI69_g4518, partial [Smittium culicis]
MEELESDSEISDTDRIENDIHDRVIPESSDCLLVEAIIGESLEIDQKHKANSLINRYE